ncbi:MAG: adenosine deaminase [Rhodovibrionaceae bacterium]
MGFRLLVVAAAGLLLAACAVPQARNSGSAESAAAARFAALQDSPPELRAFLEEMPKGGDIHSHLSGTVYAESFIAWAAEDGLCLELASTSLAEPPCSDPERPEVADIAFDDVLRAQMIDAWSMRDFVPGAESGHDHFFATFGKFGATPDGREGDMLAEAAARAAAQNIGYLELMNSMRRAEVSRLARGLDWSGDFAAFRQALLDAGLRDLVPLAVADNDEIEDRRDALLACGTPRADPGCDVELRYLQQVIRAFPPQDVFAQILLGFEIAKTDPRVVGLNLVAPEDGPVALRDYSRHMAMIGYLKSLMPEMNVTLHAGELTLGLVDPKELKFHIREAVEVAGAKRIGHGVDIAYEDGHEALLRRMAEEEILVEIALTSNDVILGVSGKEHPFALYRAAGVPLALATDDEGVSRIDLTHEFQRAAETYDLNYRDLKELARNSLTYSFLAGESLWEIEECLADALSQACAQALAGSDKAREQRELERAFAEFESAFQ